MKKLDYKKWLNVLDGLIILALVVVILYSVYGRPVLNVGIFNFTKSAFIAVFVFAHLLIVLRYILNVRSGSKHAFPAFLNIFKFKAEKNYRNIYYGIFFTSTAVLMLELMLTRIYSVTLFYHFAFIAVSVAVFGSALSGVVIYIGKKFFTPERAEKHLSFALAMMALTSIIGTMIILRLKITNDYSPLNLKNIVFIYILSAIPFFFGGMGITLCLTHYARNISKVYFSDLIGAAFGCILIIPLLNIIPAPSAIFFVAAVALLAATFFSPRKGKLRYILISLAIASYIFTHVNSGLGLLGIKSQKGRKLDYENVLFEKWNSFSRIAVYNQNHRDWSISDKFKGEPMDSLYMDIDALASTPIIKYGEQKDRAEYLEWELTYTGFIFHNAGHVFIIGPGGGRDLAAALHSGASKVDSAEINPIIVYDIMLGLYRDYTGSIYEHPGVEVHMDDARSFIRSSDKKYDVILASLVDTWAASSTGAFNLVENNLYTVEAFMDFFSHLTDSGILSIERWDSEAPRLISVAKRMAEELNVPDIKNHIVLVAHKRGVNFLLKKTPWKPEEIAKLNIWCGERNFWVMYDPFIKSRNIYNALIHDEPWAEEILSKYPYNLKPVNDNRPFFFQKEKPLSFIELIKTGIKKDTLFSGKMMFNKGISSLQFLIIVIFLLVLVLIVSPLVIFNRKELKDRFGMRFTTLLYFAVLGFGFITIEIALMQKLILLLGHPIFAFSVVLFSILVFTGLGSRYTRKWKPEGLEKIIKYPLLLLLGISVVYLVILDPIIYSLFTLPQVLRIILAVLIIAPLAFIMGMPLPLGIKYADRNFGSLIPWAWAVNGGMSVLGSALAFYLAITRGFNFVIITGVSFYAMALLLTFIFNIHVKKIKT